MPDGQGGRWLPLAQAAPLLGVQPDSLRKRIKRGRCPWPTRRENTGAWSVMVPDDVPDNRIGVWPDNRPDVPDLSGTVAELREQMARLEERLTASEAAKAELRRELADMRAERDKLLAMLDDALAEHRERHRPWPGLRRWFVRLWEGDG